MELLLAETHYSLLNKRYRLLLGLKEGAPVFIMNAAKSSSFSLESRLLNHAFYGAFFNTTSDKNSQIARQFISSNS